MNDKAPAQKVILILYGSPKKEGFTYHLTKNFLNCLEENNIRLEWINAYELQISPCLGCGYCEQEDGCPMPDFDRIDRLLRQADVLIVATPIYFLSFPAPLKAIFDRMQRYFSARFSRGIKPPIAKRKDAVLLMTCGADSGDGADVILRQVKMAFSIINAHLRGEILWSGTDHSENLPSELYTDIKKLAESL